MSFDFIILYTITIFVATIIPGPSMLLALTHGIRFGARKTMASALGNLSVTLVQAMISITGLGTVLMASQTAFQLIKYAGAAYLVYMGVCLFFSSGMIIGQDKGHPDANGSSLKKMFFQGALVTAANPKAIVFFTAVFPQFIRPDTAYLPQFCMLMSILSVIASGCFMLYAVGGEKILFWFSSASRSKAVQRIIGGTFISAGIGLAVSASD